MAQPKKNTSGKSAGKSNAKSGGKGSAAAGGSTTGQPRGGLAQKVQPDEQLAAVIGKDPVTRAEMTKKVWDYIKKNNLQDSQNRRMINADKKLRPIFNSDQVSMFEMTKLINQHVS